MLDKTYNAATIESKYQKAWREENAFASQSPNSQAPKFTIPMPPPNVTGSLHLGHALTFTIQDALTRYHRMRGYNTLWQPGTDHAGIATQMVVERQLAAEGIDRRDLGRDKFLERVWAWKEQSGGMIVDQLHKLGASADWDRSRFTMDEGLSHAVRHVFVHLHKQGLIYRDKRLVNWDPKLATAISDLEVIATETAGHLWYIKYPLTDGSGFVTVATTRPETMFGDVAVAVNPEDERYTSLIGKSVQLPFMNRELPIIADTHIDAAKGSGAVKITPAHDFNDFEIGKRHNLPMINIMDAAARLNDQVPEAFQGLDRFEARTQILAALESQGLLEKTETIAHTVPHGDRSGVIIEPWLTDQWYVDAHTLAQPAIKAVETGQTKFVPENWTNVYFEWLRNIQPWCISRQLWWGHRIPAWYGPDGHVFVAMDEAEAQAEAHLHYGAHVTLRQDDDVLDTWFSSALWPFSTLGWPEKTPELAYHYPADVLVTGFDIIFFWVARMMMMGLHFMQDVPFRTVYIHALVRDEKGQKMSKSKGNVIDPLELMHTYGADALRLTLSAHAAPGRDIKISAAKVEGYRNFITKLWNAGRYCLMNESRLMPGYDITTAQLSVNRWMISVATNLRHSVEAAIAAYRFNEAAHLLYHTVWGTFCDWYLEFTKPILATGDTPEAYETRAVMGWVYVQFLYLLHPLIPFVTEELAKAFQPDAPLLIFGPWPKEGFIDAEAQAEVDLLVRIITEVRSLRAELRVPAGEFLSLHVSPAGEWLCVKYEALIKRLARLSTVTVGEAVETPGVVRFVIDHLSFALPLGTFIDTAAEKARIDKEITRLETEHASISARLNNPGFVAKAPAEVIEESRERLKTIQDSVQLLRKLATSL